MLTILLRKNSLNYTTSLVSLSSSEGGFSSFWPISQLTNLYSFLASCEFSSISVNSDCLLLNLSTVLHLFLSLLYESQSSCVLYLSHFLSLFLNIFLWSLSCLSYHGFYCVLIFFVISGATSSRVFCNWLSSSYTASSNVSASRINLLLNLSLIL